MHYLTILPLLLALMRGRVYGMQYEFPELSTAPKVMQDPDQRPTSDAATWHGRKNVSNG